MSLAEQNVGSAFGLNKVARELAAAGAVTSLSAKLRLDPTYPWFVLPFDPSFYGKPEQIGPEDVQDYGQ